MMLHATRLCLLLGGTLPLAGAALSHGFQGVVAERLIRMRTADLAGKVKPEDAPSLPPGNKIKATSSRGLPSRACGLPSRPNSFGFLLSRRNAADCDCSDRSDMRLKIEEAQLAIQFLREEAQNLDGQIFTEEGKNALDDELQRRLDENLHGREPVTGGKTTFWCNTINNARTACMRASTARHEAVHGAACWSDRIGAVSRSFTMADYAREDIAAFNASLQFLNKELASLGDKCKKGTCGGTCTYVDPPTPLEPPRIGWVWRCKEGEWHKVPSTSAECDAIRRRNEATAEEVIPKCGPYTGYNGVFLAEAKTPEDARACVCESAAAVAAEAGVPLEPAFSKWCQDVQP